MLLWMDFITMQLIIKTMNSCESSLGPRRTLHNRRLIKGNIVDHMLLVTLVALIAQLSLAFTDAALPGSHSVLKRSREKCSTKPNLQLVTPKLVLRKANVHYNESLGEIFAPANNTKLSVECTSSSPIDFDFQGYLVSILNRVWVLKSARLCRIRVCKFQLAQNYWFISKVIVQFREILSNVLVLH